jgi:hypothetical protein
VKPAGAERLCGRGGVLDLAGVVGEVELVVALLVRTGNSLYDAALPMR